MFSTSLTTLDASPRVMTKTAEKFTGKIQKYQYLFWITLLSVGTIIILAFFTKNMKSMVTIATIVSFLTAPFYAILNLILVTGKQMPKELRPSLLMRIWSIFSIILLIAFSVWYLINLL
jgi:Mn2+/Fe2+ NRAMP family transporter